MSDSKISRNFSGFDHEKTWKLDRGKRRKKSPGEHVELVQTPVEVESVAGRQRARPIPDRDAVAENTARACHDFSRILGLLLPENDEGGR